MGICTANRYDSGILVCLFCRSESRKCIGLSICSIFGPHLQKSITQDYAKAFRTLCSMRVLLISVNGDEKIVSANRRNAVVFDQNEEYMRKIGLSFELLNELETLGVIKFDTVAGYAVTDMNEKKVLVYINGNVIETSSHIDETFPIGNVLFTSAGEALSKITEPYTLEGYEDAVIKYLKSNNVTVETESLYNVVVFGERIHVDKKKQ